MKHRGPLLTLFAGAGLAAVIGGLSVRAASQDATSQGTDTVSAGAPELGAPVSPRSAQPSSAPQRPAPMVKRDYAGYTRGGDATLAIAVRGDKAIAYLCDGRVVESWLRGSVAGGRFNLSGKHGAKLTAWSRNGKITGSALARGISFDFSVSAVKRPSGLYRLTAEVRGAKLDGGWIVLPNGRQIGLLDTNGTPGPAPSLDTSSGAVNVNGQSVSAQEVQP